MPRSILPAASLRSAQRLPAARALFLASNNLIYMALWSIGRAIFRIAANFLPALRERRVIGWRPDLHSSGVPAFLRSIVFGVGFDPAFAPSEPRQGGGMTILAPGGTLIWRRRCSRWASQTALAKATNAPSMTRLKERTRWPRTARKAWPRK
jgi:hypothetical protein